VLCRLSGDFFGQMTFMAKNASQGAGWLAGWPKSQQKVSHHFSRDVYMILYDFRCCLLTFVRGLIIFLNEISCSCERTGIP